MASSFLTVFKPFKLSSTSSSLSLFPNSIAFPPSLPTFPGSCKTALKITAVAQKWESAKVVPQADRVLIRLEELPQKSTGGVLLPKSAVKFERYLIGEVLSFGTEVSGLEAGKKVLLSDINAYEVDLGTEARHCFCRAADLLALVE